MATNPSTFTIDDLSTLAYTDGIRRRIVDRLTMDDRIPDTKSDQTFLVQALDGIDRQVLSKVKIASDDRANSSLADTQQIIAQLLLEKRSQGQRPSEAEIDVGTLLSDTEVVPGELSIGSTDLTYETFMARDEL